MNQTPDIANLVGLPPQTVLPHGPSKTYIDRFHRHVPGRMVMASYTVRAADTQDHFGVFRGVDQIEMMAQAAVVAPGVIAEAQKQGLTTRDLLDIMNIYFLGIQKAAFHRIVETGQVVLAVGLIRFFRFRQITADAQLYLVPDGCDIDARLSQLTDEEIPGQISNGDFELVSECEGIVGKGIRKPRIAT